MRGRASFHYAWVVVGVTALSLLVAAGVRATPGVLIVPLQHDFHWSRATISFAIGINIFLYVIHQLGGAIAAYAGGILRTELGTYLEAFLLAGMFCFAAALMVLFIGRGRRSPGAIPAGLPAE